MPKPERYYSAGDVSRMLGIVPQVVWYHTQRLGVGRKIGGRWIYTEKDVMAIRLHTRNKQQD